MNNIHQKLWCLKSVRAPGIVSQKRLEQHPSHFQLENFISDLTDARQFYRDNKFLNAESALLERCVYRMKLKFRSNKGFKALQKILKSLKMYMIVDMATIINKLIQINNESNQIVYAPGKCNIEYLLVRLQTVAKLMERVIEITKESALYIHSVIGIGHIWKVLVVCFGIISRLRVNAINILKYTCTLYLQTKHFYDNYYDSTAECWIPNRYKFPDDLKEWIGLEWFNQECTEKESKSIFTVNFENDLSLLEHIEDGDSEREEKTANEMRTQPQHNSYLNKNTVTSSKTMHLNIVPKYDLEDIGEIVNREMVKSQLINKKQKKKLKKKQDKSNSEENKIVSKGSSCITKKKKKKLKKMKVLVNKKGKDKH
ncbi:uncharacterized protein LOC108744336 [Agrilus planipennis]|uniref:Uncharacterized protein LOC108744336 n=1 Tax=Agrilus planipennis TaxID=224129 RepID=A0A1W4XHT3_AGRPL|nr:uncharacterized protein LOC108744336 [Agrilus planipennis]